MRYCLGIDTSNYTTSAALCCVDTLQIASSAKRLLEVKEGEKGLRQSDAVFQHIKALPHIVSEALSCLSDEDEIVCVAVSDRPSEQEGSYMPCFLAGVSAASVSADSMRAKKYTFSHQAGHISAAVFSANRPELLEKEFLAFHISGGTTQALLVTPDNDKIFNIKCIGGSNDLKAGQAVDRIGGMLGLSFPAGPELEKLAEKSQNKYVSRVKITHNTFSLSGLENKARKMLADGETAEDIARWAIDTIGQNISACVDSIMGSLGDMPIVFAGGVMSNKIIRRMLEEKYDSAFAEPCFSSDNAAGTAILGALSFLRGV